MIIDHDEMFKSISNEDRQRVIRGELCIVTKGGNTMLVETPRQQIGSTGFPKCPIVRPSEPYHKVKR